MQQQERTVLHRSVETLERKYGVILADPPWAYRNAGCRGAAANEYSTMDAEAICALPIKGLAADDSVLLMWATWPKLDEAFQVIDA